MLNWKAIIAGAVVDFVGTFMATMALATLWMVVLAIVASPGDDVREMIGHSALYLAVSCTVGWYFDYLGGKVAGRLPATGAWCTVLPQRCPASSSVWRRLQTAAGCLILRGSSFCPASSRSVALAMAGPWRPSADRIRPAALFLRQLQEGGMQFHRVDRLVQYRYFLLRDRLHAFRRDRASHDQRR